MTQIKLPPTKPGRFSHTIPSLSGQIHLDSLSVRLKHCTQSPAHRLNARTDYVYHKKLAYRTAAVK